MTSKFDLTTKELMLLQSEMKNVEKSLGLAYLMLIGGHLGVHRFYLKRTRTAMIQLVLFFLSVVLYYCMIIAFTPEVEMLSSGRWIAAILVTILFIAAALALFIWIITDLFLMPRMIRDWNQREEEQLIRKILELREQSSAEFS